MSAEDLIDSFAEDVTVIRHGSGAWSGPEYTEGSETELDIRMSVQPLTGKELMNLPEAQRTKRMIKGYTDTELMTANEATKQKADTVIYNNTTFEVQTVERWRGDMNYFKVMLVEENA